MGADPVPESGAARVEIQFGEAAGEPPPGSDIPAWVGAVIEDAEVGPVEVLVRLVGEAEGGMLNNRFRGREGATNVLSFAGPSPDALPPGIPRPLGDIVVCLPLVRREAARRECGELAHLAHLVVHGTLHLLGHDHQKPAEARIMEALESRLMQSLGFRDPWAAEQAVRGSVTDGHERRT